MSIFSFGQKYIQIETVNRIKVKRIAIGETLTFKMKGKNSDWLTKDVTNIIPSENIILLNDEMIKIDQIAAFRRERYFFQGFAKQLYRFGAAWLVYGSIGRLAKQYTFSKKDIIVPGSSVALGFILQKGFKYKYTRFGNRKRLRLVDLSFR